MESTDRRKGQLAMSKRRFRFKNMVRDRIAKGNSYCLPMDILVETFMEQPESTRVQGIAFLKGFEVAANIDDTQISDADTQKADEVDAQFSRSDAQKSFIPLGTSRDELTGMLIDFFKARAIPSATVRGTMLEVAQRYSPMEAGDFPMFICNVINEIPPDTQCLANALLGGLRKAEYGDTAICNILDSIADGIRSPDKTG
ncbi:MAG: hypothetical protein F9K32_00575 [Desulfobulbaceae bacterium]|nr:MAG: hypothetical protein F9K32_00575 [Desulfobulbaceae bacterium]